MTVNQILKTKGSEVFSIKSNITVYDAIKVMGEKNIGAVLVMEDNLLKGMLSERDYARKIVLKDKSSKETLVHEIMDRNVITVNLADNLNFCMQLMISKRVRHLAVMEDKIVLGVISMGDVVKGIIELQENTIKHLDSYISGTKT
jgi:CBS domain-containing protein